ncbi:uncharacterized protein LOC124274300, partial [Haliotis rubra]|uniref:uncharacterized protein LOC124274300 n=1 Tax=Haliotis rubra TaxID=36100 RepID=UPI001EE548FD
SFKKDADGGICQDCPDGSYNTSSGATVCTECPKGFFCPQNDRLPQACPQNSFCPPGSTSPHSCNPPLYVIDGSGTGCKPTGELMAIIGGCSAVAVVVVLIVSVQCYFKWKKQRTLMPAGESEPLTRSTQPVYQGL